MAVKRRGIRLKQLSPDDSSLQELLDSDLCLPDDPDDPAFIGEAAPDEPEGPSVAELTREVLEGLHETLAILEPGSPGAEGAPTSSGDSEANQDER
jgi:hypothetical protein